MPTKTQLEKELKACNIAREKAEERVIQLENDIVNIKGDKLWNFLCFISGVLFLIFVLYMDIDGSAVSLGAAGGKFEGNGLYLLSIIIMFGNRLLNLFGFFANFKITRSTDAKSN